MIKDSDIYKIANKRGSHDLGYMVRLMELLGNPQNSFKYIHVAGTNGKGSICAYLYNIMRAAGFKTGLFTSPHLVHVNERIEFDGKKVENAILSGYLQRIRYITKISNMEEPGFFEYMYSAAMLHFREMKAEIAVIETGMGGLTDVTNIIEKPVLTLISSVSMEHRERLGGTITEIARHKAGIIKREVPVVFDGRDKAASKVILKRAGELSSKAFEIDPEMAVDPVIRGKYIDFSFENLYHKINVFSIETCAMYQCMNAMCAARGAEVMGIPETVIKKGLMNTGLKGRFQNVKGKLYTDGAHNPGGMEAFVKSVDEAFPDNKLIIIFASAKDKDHDEMIAYLSRLKNVKAMIFTKADEHRGEEPDKLKDEAGKHFSGDVFTDDHVKEALEKAYAIADKEDIIFAVGSLYLTGSVYEIAEGLYDKLR